MCHVAVDEFCAHTQYPQIISLYVLSSSRILNVFSSLVLIMKTLSVFPCCVDIAHKLLTHIVMINIYAA